jgi:hypothetical protein
MPEPDEQQEKDYLVSFTDPADGSRWEGPVTETETDTVEELLRKDYSSDIIQDVREFAPPNWVDSDSSLDGIDDLEEYWWYNFRMPPHQYDRVQQLAEQRIQELEQLKGEVDPALISQIEQRKQLVAGKPLEEVARLKHAAYYRAMQQLRAAKAAQKQQDQQQALEAAGAPTDIIPANLITMTPAEYLERSSAQAAASTSASSPSSSSGKRGSKQQQQQGAYKDSAYHPSRQQVEDPEVWDPSWTNPGYTRHPQVVAQLADAVSSLFPGRSSQQVAGAGEDSSHALAAAAAPSSSSYTQQQYRKWAQKVTAAAAARPFQAYTPAYAAQLAREQRLQQRRRLVRQAFLLGLGAVLLRQGWRWWRGRGKAQARQQQQQVAGGSRRRQQVPA